MEIRTCRPKTLSFDTLGRDGQLYCLELQRFWILMPAHSGYAACEFYLFSSMSRE